jgi:hypothetical protein
LQSRTPLGQGFRVRYPHSSLAAYWFEATSRLPYFGFESVPGSSNVGACFVAAFRALERFK